MKADFFFKVGIPTLSAAAAAYTKYNWGGGEENPSSHKCAPAAPVQTPHPCPPVGQYQSEHGHHPQYSQPQHYLSQGDEHLQHSSIHELPHQPNHLDANNQHSSIVKTAPCSSMESTLIGAACHEPPSHC